MENQPDGNHPEHQSNYPELASAYPQPQLPQSEPRVQFKIIPTILVIAATIFFTFLYAVILWLFNFPLFRGPDAGWVSTLNGYANLPLAILVCLSIFLLFRKSVHLYVFFVIFGCFIYFIAAGIFQESSYLDNLYAKQNAEYDNKALESIAVKRKQMRAEFNNVGQFYSISHPDGFQLTGSSYILSMGRLDTTLENSQTGTKITVWDYQKPLPLTYGKKEISFTTKQGLAFNEIITAEEYMLSLVSDKRRLYITVEPADKNSAAARFVAENLKLEDAANIILYESVCSDSYGGLEWNGPNRLVCDTDKF